MAKRFKLRIPSILSSCHSKDSSTFPIPPIPIFRKPINDLRHPPSPPTIKRHVSSSSMSVGCGWRSKPKKQYIRYYSNITTTSTPPRRKVYNSPFTEESDGYVSPSPAFQKKTTKKPRFSNCSAETAWFSSEELSDSFSSSFSDSGAHLDPINETPISGLIVKKKKKKKRSGRVKRVKYYGSKNKVAPKICNTTESEAEEGKLKESLAVMKKSEDPYGDFRRSMMEMIVEKEMFETSDLEQLLHCFLSLNSRHHYGAIIAAFSDIWEILFGKSAVV